MKGRQRDVPVMLAARNEERSLGTLVVARSIPDAWQGGRFLTLKTLRLVSPLAHHQTRAEVGPAHSPVIQRLQ